MLEIKEGTEIGKQEKYTILPFWKSWFFEMFFKL